MGICVFKNTECINQPQLREYVKKGGNGMQKFCFRCKVIKGKEGKVK